MNEEPDRTHDDEEFPDPQSETNVIVRTSDLFGERREIWIEHNGERYRLRITRRGKLILQK